MMFYIIMAHVFFQSSEAHARYKVIVVQVTQFVVPEAANVPPDITIFRHPTRVNAVSYAFTYPLLCILLTGYKEVHSISNTVLNKDSTLLDNTI